MPFTNYVYLTNSSPGATRNSGTNGDLNVLLNWALPQVGWAREYHNAGTNESIFRPATGNRFRIYVAHSSAISGDARKVTVRGCENASDASTLIDPFPTVAQVANASATIQVSSAASTTDREFAIVAWDTGFIYFSQMDGVDDYNPFMFMDAVQNGDADTWGTFIWQRGVNGTGGSATNITGSTILTAPATPQIYWARSIDGTTKSTAGAVYASGSSLGSITNAPDLSSGYLGKIRRQNVYASCSVSGLTRRGAIPHLWEPQHNGMGIVTAADTFSDTAYDPTATFRALKQNTGISILELTNTWKLV